MSAPRSSVLSTVYQSHYNTRDKIIALVRFAYTDEELQSAIDLGTVLEKQTVGGWLIIVSRKAVGAIDLVLQTLLIDQLAQLSEVLLVEIEIRRFWLKESLDLYEFGLPGAKNLNLMNN